MDLEYNNIDKIAQRLSMLQVNVEAINNALYSIYLTDVEDDLEIIQYGQNGTVSDVEDIPSTYDLSPSLFQRQVPSYRSFINSLVLHGETNPNGIYTAETAGQLYINYVTKEIWVNLEANTNNNWELVLSDASLIKHNRDIEAHSGTIRINTLVFDQSTSVYDNVGIYESLSDLYNYEGELESGDYAFVKSNSVDSLKYYKYIYESGLVWSEAEQSSLEIPIKSTTFDGENFLAVGTDNHVYESEDGVNWTLITTPNADKIIYGNNYYFILRSDNNGYYSTDKIEWTEVGTGIPSTLTINDIVYGDGMFCVLASNGSVYYTTDLTSLWTFLYNSASSNKEYTYITYAYDGTHKKFIAISPTVIEREVDGQIVDYYPTKSILKVDNMLINSDILEVLPESFITGPLFYNGSEFVKISSDGYTSTSIDGRTNWSTPSLISNLGNHGWSNVTYTGNKCLLSSGTTDYVSASLIGAWNCIGSYKGSYVSLDVLIASVTSPVAGDFADVRDGYNRNVYVYGDGVWSLNYITQDTETTVGALARLKGNSEQPFEVKNIISDSIYTASVKKNANVAITKNYIGETTSLKSGSTPISEINDIKNSLENSTFLLENATKEENFSIVKGNLTEGKADLIDASLAHLSTDQQYVNVGTYMINVMKDDEIEIELVGGGGCFAYTDGGRDNYGDTAYAHHYKHSGGGGAYFKGTFKAPSNGVLEIYVPAGKNYTRGIYDTYSDAPWINFADDGEDAVATFRYFNGRVEEVARAGGGKRGYPWFSYGFYASVEGGKVSYNDELITVVDKAIDGTIGVVVSAVFS